MPIDATSLFEAALQLSENERADLAAKLLESLDGPPDPDYEAAWAEEIKRRVEDLRSGREQTIPWSEARKIIMDDSDDTDAD